MATVPIATTPAAARVHARDRAKSANCARVLAVATLITSNLLEVPYRRALEADRANFHDLRNIMFEHILDAHFQRRG